MKQYKVVMEDDAEELEEEINKLAKEGYEVVSFIPVGVATASALMVKEETSVEKAMVVCKQCPYFSKEDKRSTSYCGLKNWTTKEDNKCLCPKDLEEALYRRLYKK